MHGEKFGFVYERRTDRNRILEWIWNEWDTIQWTERATTKNRNIKVIELKGTWSLAKRLSKKAHIFLTQWLQTNKRKTRENKKNGNVGLKKLISSQQDTKYSIRWNGIAKHSSSMWLNLFVFYIFCVCAPSEMLELYKIESNIDFPFDSVWDAQPDRKPVRLFRRLFRFGFRRFMPFNSIQTTDRSIERSICVDCCVATTFK